MAKFWNFVLFQAGWFACIIGAANQRVFWPVLVTLAYLGIHIWRSPSPKNQLSLVLKVFLYGLGADTLLLHLGVVRFYDTWPSIYLSPLWMWTLWALVGSTINGSLAWLKGKPLLGGVLGAICGPVSYGAGIQMGAGTWGSGNQTWQFVAVGLIWGLAIPLFLSWEESANRKFLAQNAQ